MAMDLAALKADLSITDDTDDAALAQCLNAALAFVKDKRPDVGWDGATETLPGPTATQELGVLRLAGRWFTRRRTPDGLIDMGDAGTTRVPAYDPDIERMLGLGRYHGPVIA